MNHMLKHKYTMLKTSLSKLSERQLRQYKDWKEQECEETNGLLFLSTSDLRSDAECGPSVVEQLASSGAPRTAHDFVQSTWKAVLNILRHLSRLKHLTAQNVTRYVVVS